MVEHVKLLVLHMFVHVQLVIRIQLVQQYQIFVQQFNVLMVVLVQTTVHLLFVVVQ